MLFDGTPHNLFVLRRAISAELIHSLSLFVDIYLIGVSVGYFEWCAIFPFRW
jgi:hypothetical protein